MGSPREASCSPSPSVRRSSNRLLQVIALVLLVFLAVATQIPSPISFTASNAFRSPEGVSTADKFEHMFATKTKYWDQRDGSSNYNDAVMVESLMTLSGVAEATERAPLRQELELIQTQIVARHGIRYPTGGNIKEINDLLEKLKPFRDLLPAWMKNYTLPYNLSVQGELAVTGQHELRKLGADSLARSGHSSPVTYSKGKYRLAHTHVARTRDSAIAFAGSFFENPKDVEYIEYPKSKDIFLRFFDQCERYQRDVKKNQTAQKQLHEFQRSSVMAKVAQWLKQALGLKGEDINFSAKDLMAVQSACAFDIAIYHHKHHWCSLMSMTFIHSLDYLDDLEEFYWIGGGYRINYEMAAVLLREVFSEMTGRVTGNSTLEGNFFFAHAETTLPLMTLLGYGDRSLLLANATEAAIKARGFRTSILSPFAANLQFRLHERKSSGKKEFYVQVLVNEKQVPIPGCGRVFCKLSELENLWHYYLKTYNFHEDCL
ncbi:PHOsphatase [Phytophthora pseudosyringae]|uniref:PHOsphatase n=1 Tax=Phytophthora pseudosyringae TaxID=221518 RepID=A0A8T1W8A4_9STRA|nr:PHOsphatase [Phytophthora pseudosyringae]